MITIIAGSRGASCDDVYVAMKRCEWTPSRVISGGARGADHWGEIWAVERNIPLTVMPAEWDNYGRGAGYIRNREMAKVAEALVAVWNGSSKGTKHMIEVAQERGLKVFIYRCKDANNDKAIHL